MRPEAHGRVRRRRSPKSAPYYPLSKTRFSRALAARAQRANARAPQNVPDASSRSWEACLKDRSWFGAHPEAYARVHRSPPPPPRYGSSSTPQVVVHACHARTCTNVHETRNTTTWGVEHPNPYWRHPPSSCACMFRVFVCSCTKHVMHERARFACLCTIVHLVHACARSCTFVHGCARSCILVHDRAVCACTTDLAFFMHACFVCSCFVCSCMKHVRARSCMLVHVRACLCMLVHVRACSCMLVHVRACLCTIVHVCACTTDLAFFMLFVLVRVSCFVFRARSCTLVHVRACLCMLVHARARSCMLVHDRARLCMHN